MTTPATTVLADRPQLGPAAVHGPGARAVAAARVPAGATLRAVRTEAERAAVYRLRYDVYVEEQGKRPHGADHGRRWLTDELDDASVTLYAEEGGHVVGTVRRTDPGRGYDFRSQPAALEIERFPLDAGNAVTLCSRFVVAADHRHSWVAPALLVDMYARGRQVGAVFNLIATNPALVPLYERLGYVRYTAGGHLADVGLLVPMVLVLTDHEHLRRTRSCLALAVADHPHDPRWSAWLRATFPLVGDYYSADAPAVASSLLAPAGLSAECVRQLARRCFVHRFAAGDVLRRAGDRDTCCFVVLSGRLAWTDGGETAGETDPAPRLRCEDDAEVLCVPHDELLSLRECDRTALDRLRALAPRDVAAGRAEVVP